MTSFELTYVSIEYTVKLAIHLVGNSVTYIFIYL